MTTNALWGAVLVAFVLGVIGGAALQPFVTPVTHRSFTVQPTPSGCDWVNVDERQYPFDRDSVPLAHGQGKLACGSHLEVNSTTSIFCQCQEGAPRE